MKTKNCEAKPVQQIESSSNILLRHLKAIDLH